MYNLLDSPHSLVVSNVFTLNGLLHQRDGENHHDKQAAQFMRIHKAPLSNDYKMAEIYWEMLKPPWRTAR